METVRGMVLEKEKPTHLPIRREEIYVKLPRERISGGYAEIIKYMNCRLIVGGNERSKFIESITYDPNDEPVKTKKYR